MPFFLAPKLESLVIETTASAQGPHHQFFLDYIKKHGPSRYPLLRKIQIWDIDCPKDFGPDFFLNLPLINHAVVLNVANNGILEQLSKERKFSSAPLFWPCLKYLELSSLCDMDILRDLVCCRIDAGRPLETLSITMEDEEARFPEGQERWLKDRVKLTVYEAISTS